MNIKRMFKGIIGVLMLLALPALIASCGSGGGSVGSGGQGSVAILLTDWPTSEFNEVIVTINRIELLGEDDEKVELFSGEKTVDLLDLSGESMLFSISSGVPAGWFSKLRLHVSSIKLVRPDSSVVFPKLPGGGKIDLNPRRKFFVTAGETLVVELDMDAEKSIHIVKTGASGKYIFRPVVFIKILDGLEEKGRLVRVEGVARDKDTEDETFKVCPDNTVFRAAKTTTGDDTVDPVSLDGRCVPVFVEEDTSFFDNNGEPVEFSFLMNGDFVSVVGKVRFHDDDDWKSHWDDDGDDDGVTKVGVTAEVVEVGDFLNISGIVRSEVDTETDRFDFDPDPGQGITGDEPLPVEMQDGTKVFTRKGMELTPDEINPGLVALVDGVLVVLGSEADFMRAALVILETDPSETVELTGSVTELDTSERTFTLDRSSEDPVCVKVPEDSYLFLVTVTDGGFTSEEITIDDLSNDQEVTLYGFFDTSGCFVARVVLASPVVTPL